MGQTSNEDHMEMLSAIKKRDTERAEILVREHILRGQGIVLKALENSPELF
jgi:DNA-binding GntR family transcriptional regulator